MEKPGLSPELLRIARTMLSVLYTVALAVCMNEQAMAALGLAKYQALWTAIAAVLAGKELFPRTGDVSPSKHVLEVERAASMRPPPVVLVNTTEPPPSAEQ